MTARHQEVFSLNFVSTNFAVEYKHPTQKENNTSIASTSVINLQINTCHQHMGYIVVACHLCTYVRLSEPTATSKKLLKIVLFEPFYNDFRVRELLAEQVIPAGELENFRSN